MSDVPPIGEFANESDLQLKSIDKSYNFKSNFYLIEENFENLVKWLSRFKAYAILTNNSVDVTNLVNLAVAKMQTMKTSIVISGVLITGQIVNQTVNGIVYRVTKIDSQTITISNVNDSEWNVDNILVMIKDSYNTLVYPVIITNNNQIRISFSYDISDDYRAIII